MSGRRGKRRTHSQRIGEIGESTFKTWATENLLSPQKVDQDYGVDFFSQVFSPISRKVEELTGAVLAAQVRSVEGGSRPRVKVSKTDIENAMRVQVPFCFFAVDTHEKKVFWLFLNEELIRRFSTFLEGKQETMSIRLNQFHSDDEQFSKALSRASKYGQQSRLQILKAELDLTHAMPGSQLTVAHGSKGGIGIIRLPWITQAFDVPSESRDSFAALVFEQSRLPTPGELLNVRLHRSMDSVHDLVEGPVLISGPFEALVRITVKYNESSAEHPFLLRRAGDERAYVDSESGLAIVVSDPRLRNGVYVHDMAVRYIRENAHPLDDFSNKGFLRLLRPGALINEADREGVSIDHWSDLERIGPALDAIELVRNKLGLNTSHVVLADLKDQEFAMTLTLLDALLTGIGMENIVPGFVLGPAAGNEPQAEKWRPAGFRIPIIANFGKVGLVLWIEGIGDVYILENAICGFRIRRQTRWEHEARDTPFKKPPYPEAIIAEEWPAILLFHDLSNYPRTFDGGIKHSIFGEVCQLLLGGDRDEFSR